MGYETGHRRNTGGNILSITEAPPFSDREYRTPFGDPRISVLLRSLPGLKTESMDFYDNH